VKRTIICDIDGTLADLSHRLHHIRPGPGQRKNWAAFFDSVFHDAVHTDMRIILDRLYGNGDHNVIYVSGRMERCRWATERWLILNCFPPGEVFMRRDGDYRPDYTVKEEILDRQLKLTPADVLCVPDDRDQVVDMWRTRGFRVLQVADGAF
jgi:hypothetical protein